VSVHLRPGDANDSSVVFGGYDEDFLYPNKQGKFLMLPMVYEKGLIFVNKVKATFQDLTISTDAKIQVDSFYPGIVLPNKEWKILYQYVLNK
jgi:hypothetical protein